MGEYLRQEFNVQFNTDIVSGFQNEDYDRRVGFTCYSNWKYAKLVWQGPSKAPIGFSIGGMMKMAKENEALVK